MVSACFWILALHIAGTPPPFLPRTSPILSEPRARTAKLHRLSVQEPPQVPAGHGAIGLAPPNNLEELTLFQYGSIDAEALDGADDTHRRHYRPRETLYGRLTTSLRRVAPKRPVSLL